MGEAHAGRLLDHVHLRVADLAASRRFYEGAHAPLGIPVRAGEHSFAADELYVSDDGEPTTGFHFAFQAADQETVQRFYDAALAAGGRDNGAPGIRENYEPTYYAAFVIDPDGYRLEAYHGGPQRFG